MTGTKSRDELVREADLARARLLDTVEKLDQRRHEILDPRVQLRRQLRPLAVGGFVVVAMAAAGSGLVVHRVATADRRRRRERRRLLREMWRHPERAMRGERRSLAESVVRSALVTLVSAAASIVARRLLVG
jgi:hypothetical protein